MTTLFVILIILASAILGAIVLIQNPKGGGLAGNIAGFSTQFMGVKQTTDVLEKRYLVICRHHCSFMYCFQHFHQRPQRS